MSIYRKKGGKVWYAEVYVRELKRCVCRSTGKTDREEALEVERMLRAGYERTLPAQRLHALIDAMFGDEAERPTPGTSISAAYGKYLSQLQTMGRQLNRKTLGGRRRNLTLFATWRDANAPGCKYVCDVTRSMAGAYAAEFNASGKLSDKSKREGIGDLSAVWNVLMSVDETIRENPWRFFRKSVKKQRTITAFSPEEERRILAAAEGTEWHTACVVSRWTGLRFGDVCRLAWGDVDWAEGVLRTEPSKTKGRGIVVLVPLSPLLRQELERVRGETGGVGHIMPTLHRYYPLPEKSHLGSFHDLMVRAKVDTEHHTFHSWRHTFVTRGGEAGVSRELLMRMAGHTTELMSRHYDHSERLADLRKAMETMADVAEG